MSYEIRFLTLGMTVDSTLRIYRAGEIELSQIKYAIVILQKEYHL